MIFSVRSFLSQPDLAAAEERDADEAAHVELLAAVDQLHSGAINFSVFRIECFPALIFVALFRESPENRHPQHRLITPRAFTFLAARRWIVSRLGKYFFQFAFVLPVHFANSN